MSPSGASRRGRAARPDAATYRRRRAIALVAALAIFVVIIAVLASLGGGSPPPDKGDQQHEAAQALILVGLRKAPLTPLQKHRRRESDALSQVLGYTSFISRGSPRKREVALTFDDGPSQFTDDIVRALQQQRAPGTFFVIGNQVADFADNMIAAERAGMVI